MPRTYLKSIEHAAFPLRVEDQEAIGRIHRLRAAGLVEAGITPSTQSDRGYELAVVHRITLKGREELDRMRRGDVLGDLG